MHINKFRCDTFVEGSSDLHGWHQAKGIDIVIITGCAANICCKLIAHDAMMTNYKVLFVSDGKATVLHLAIVSVAQVRQQELLTAELDELRTRLQPSGSVNRGLPCRRDFLRRRCPVNAFHRPFDFPQNRFRRSLAKGVASRLKST